MAINAAIPKHGRSRVDERVAAIDAGSNAIRLMIAEVKSTRELRVLKTVRWPVRLGHKTFLRRRLDERVTSAAIRAFREAEGLFEKFRVGRYRAVATSAAREARNSGALVRRVFRETGIRLEVISSVEEVRLGREAVLGVLGKSARPRLILDLGGGSLELCLVQRGDVRKTAALPLGTVRMIEAYRLGGAISEEDSEELAHYARMMLESYWPDRPLVPDGNVVACGGNAEALARFFPGPRSGGINTLNVRLLKDRIWDILRLGVEARMNEFGVRRDRAEVMGVAAIVLVTVGSWLRVRSFLAPGVGVREGVLRDLVGRDVRKPARQETPAAYGTEPGAIYADARR